MTSLISDFDFKKKTFFKNAICTIKCNIYFNLQELNNIIGGQLSSTLPGVRLVKIIDGNRYVFIIYKSGTIVLTNIFFLNNIHPLINFLSDMFIFCIYKNIAKFHVEKRIIPASSDSYEDYNDYDQLAKKIEFSILVENFQFSFQINEVLFDHYYLKQRRRDIECLYIGRETGETNIKNRAEIIDYNFYKFLYKRLVEYEFNFDHLFISFKNNFPADLLKIHVSRGADLTDLINLKSCAAKRRKKNDFSDQIISVHFFNNGKMIITGAQTKNDIFHIEIILNIIIEYFFTECCTH
jgi:TATA-box binding protein (TBP) (component of TFIID and TFIIIB)